MCGGRRGVYVNGVRKAVIFHRMDNLSIIRDAHQWLRWLTDRTMVAARTLNQQELQRAFPIGLESVIGTLRHLCGAEFIWIKVITGDSAAIFPSVEQLPTLDAIDAKWKSTRAEWDRFLSALTPAECERVIERLRDGTTYRQRVIDACMQLPTHALYHNAQISFIFRSMGKSLPDSSWILWSRQRG